MAAIGITDAQLDHFERKGFFFVPNPLGAEGMREVDARQQEVEPVWEQTEFPGCNRLACQFLMIGEPLLKMVESPILVEAARRILGAEDVHVGACGIGDASQGRSIRQVYWHVDGGPEVRQVSFRTALDRHDTSNAPLRVLPGSHHRSREEVEAELMQIELATGTHEEPPEHCYARHPEEVEVILDPRWTLIWTPSCWHATGLKTGAGPRRAMGWNYFPPGGRKRDVKAVMQLHPEWRDWPEERRRLWGLDS